MSFGNPPGNTCLLTSERIFLLSRIFMIFVFIGLLFISNYLDVFKIPTSSPPGHLHHEVKYGDADRVSFQNHNAETNKDSKSFRINSSNEYEDEEHQIAMGDPIDCEDLSKTGYKNKGHGVYPIKFMDLKPPAYLSNYRNPCWYEDFPSKYTYSHQTRCRHPNKYFPSAVKLWDSLRANGTKRRLRCLPYFYIIGVTKSGTTDLYKKLIMHPMVSQALFKEPQWWNRERMKLPIPKDPLKDYVDLFDLAAAEIESTVDVQDDGTEYHPLITGEASAGTIWMYDMWHLLPENEGFNKPKVLTAHYIHHFQPDVKSIVILRDPTTRLHADYYYFHKKTLFNSTSSEDFHEMAVKSVEMVKECMDQVSVRQCLYNTSFFTNRQLPIKHIRTSIYFPYIRDWLEVFPRQQLLVIKMEDYSTDRISNLNQLFKFLGIGNISDSWGDQIQSSDVINKNKFSDTRPPLLEKTRAILDDFFAPYNKLLANLLNDNRFLWKS